MTTTSNRVLNREELVRIAGLCADSRAIGEMVSQLGRVILPSLELSAIALTPVEPAGRPVKSIVACGVPLDASAHRKIARHIAHRIDDIIQRDVTAGDMAVVRVACSIPTHAVIEIDDHSVAWGTMIETDCAKRYVLTAFGPRHEVNHHAMKAELSLLGDLLALSPPLSQNSRHQADKVQTIIELTVEHYQAIEAVFGREEAQQVMEHIEESLTVNLPLDSRFTRKDRHQLLAIINGGVNDARQIIAKCQSACANMELDGKILIKLVGSVSQTRSIESIQSTQLSLHKPAPLPQVESLAS